MSCCDENEMLQSLILIGPHDAQFHDSMKWENEYVVDILFKKNYRLDMARLLIIFCF